MMRAPAAADNRENAESKSSAHLAELDDGRLLAPGR
jgi:hypothetical protein